MFVTYRPEDGDEQAWTFDPAKVRSSKAEMIEKRFGDSWDKWKVAVQSGSMRARRVLLWHLLTLQHHGLRFEDVPDFLAGELVVQHSASELRQIRATVVKAKVPDAEKETILASLDGEIEEQEQKEAADGAEPEGKARSKRAANATP